MQPATSKPDHIAFAGILRPKPSITPAHRLHSTHAALPFHITQMKRFPATCGRPSGC
ncbi:MAG: hypothetical protein M3Y50_11940 [Acidobacteriota bacterium]|nr:hypothetical protein [Acidobacteriota bacterium]